MIEASQATSDAAHSIDRCPGWLVQALEWVQTVSDLVGVTAIAVALLVATLRWIHHEFSLLRTPRNEANRWKGIHSIRVFLGNYILFGLEFMVVSDIIHSFLQPELNSLLRLGLLVLIRTMISYFLGREIEMARNEEASP